MYHDSLEFFETKLNSRNYHLKASVDYRTLRQTCPLNEIPDSLPSGNYPITSGEQAFISEMQGGYLRPLTIYSSMVLCQRPFDRDRDSYHRDEFNELSFFVFDFNTSERLLTLLKQITHTCYDNFVKRGAPTEFLTIYWNNRFNDGSSEPDEDVSSTLLVEHIITLADIRIGSYRLRQFGGFFWISATGMAAWRFRQALEHALQLQAVEEVLDEPNQPESLVLKILPDSGLIVRSDDKTVVIEPDYPTMLLNLGMNGIWKRNNGKTFIIEFGPNKEQQVELQNVLRVFNRSME